jgi:predicted DCC family thiol-disulfide oxidoreductase YuxK
MANGPITMLYDGNCPICRQAACRLRAGSGLIFLDDIAALGFDATRYGLRKEDVTQVLHVVLPDGEIVTRMRAIRKVYEAVGLGGLARWTNWPVIRTITDIAYALFARHRVRLGRLLGSRGGQM